jgi:hypothetical protein
MGVVIVVDVVEVIIADGGHEASKSSLMSAGKRLHPLECHVLQYALAPLG